VLIGFRGGLLTFLGLDNFRVLVHDNTIIAIAALGMLLVIITGGIDLSVGSVVALVTVVTMWVFRFVYAGPDAVPLLSGPTSASSWHGTQSVLLASVAGVVAGNAAGGRGGAGHRPVRTPLPPPPLVPPPGLPPRPR